MQLFSAIHLHDNFLICTRRVERGSDLLPCRVLDARHISRGHCDDCPAVSFSVDAMRFHIWHDAPNLANKFGGGSSGQRSRHKKRSALSRNCGNRTPTKATPEAVQTFSVYGGVRHARSERSQGAAGGVGVVSLLFEPPILMFNRSSIPEARVRLSQISCLCLMPCHFGLSHLVAPRRFSHRNR